MLVGKAAASKESAPPREFDCPLDDAEVRVKYGRCIEASRGYSADVLKFLKARSAERNAAWLKRTVETGRVAFQPWNMEILFALAVQRRARFTELQALLGASSRTLSDKLQALREAGFVERTVFDEQPVRIEYSLTAQGKRVAALATPLFAALNRPDVQ